MYWYVLAIISAFFEALYYTLIKKLVRKEDIRVIASGVFLTGAVILFSASLVRGIPEIGTQFYSSVFVTGILNVFAVVLYFRALKKTDISLSLPMLSFTPLFLIVTSFLILGELPSYVGGMGILLIVSGSYVINMSTDHKELFYPIQQILRNNGVLDMLGVAFIFSISANYNKIAVLNSDPILSSAGIFLVTAVPFLVYAKTTGENIIRSHKKVWGWVLATGLVISLTAVLINIALTMQIVPYVISLKRLAVLFAVIFGGVIFHEKHIARRLIGTLIMLAGAIIIVLY
jgi:drug/metabolite transporter (DMT)-like permease